MSRESDVITHCFPVKINTQGEGVSFPQSIAFFQWPPIMCKEYGTIIPV